MIIVYRVVFLLDTTDRLVNELLVVHPLIRHFLARIGQFLAARLHHRHDSGNGRVKAVNNSRGERGKVLFSEAALSDGERQVQVSGVGGERRVARNDTTAALLVRPEVEEEERVRVNGRGRDALR